MKLKPVCSPEIENIEVGLEHAAYPIYIGQGTFAGLGDALNLVSFPRKVAIVSNELVFSLYGDLTQTLLEAAGYKTSVILIGDGEKYKNLTTLSYVYDELVLNDIDRSCGIIALGGGGP